jgi:hypothetical protein
MLPTSSAPADKALITPSSCRGSSCSTSPLGRLLANALADHPPPGALRADLGAKSRGDTAESADLPPAAANDSSSGGAARAGVAAGGVRGGGSDGADADAALLLTSVPGVGRDGRGEAPPERGQAAGEKGCDWLLPDSAIAAAAKGFCDAMSGMTGDVLFKRAFSSALDASEPTGAGDARACCCCCMCWSSFALAIFSSGSIPAAKA